MKSRREIGQCQRWVIKVGSSLLTRLGRGLDGEIMDHWVDQMAVLRKQGRDLILVSSGAVAEGMHRLGWSKRPHALFELQAAAAMGQMGLVQAYESRFQKHGMHTAQILTTHEDLSDRQRYLNTRNTLRALLNLGVIPVVNENDTVATEEIRFGDNDTLAALMANLVVADLLVILTDQAGLFDGDPRKTNKAKLIPEADAGDPKLESIAGGSGALGCGGMLTKVQAAVRAARSGTATLIVSGREPRVLERIAEGEELGTLLRPPREPLAARKQWLAAQLQVRGRLHLDSGAVQVLQQSGRSLLPVGVTAADGEFARGELVSCHGPNGEEIARGLVNYSAADSRKIIGCASDRIEELLGYVDGPELIHRDNLVLL